MNINENYSAKTTEKNPSNNHTQFQRQWVGKL